MHNFLVLVIESANLRTKTTFSGKIGDLEKGNYKIRGIGVSELCH